MTTVPLKIKVSEFKYWHFTRKTQKIVPWIARKLPAKLKYYVVIHGMVTVEQNSSPEGVTGMQLLALWQDSVK